MRKGIVTKQQKMKLDIGVKIDITRGDDDDDLTSSNLWITKDRSFPLFLSGETENMFILTTQLKGFGRDNVGMKINEDGTQITISWKKPVWEIAMREGNVHKEVKMVGFTKAFRVPDGVVLDRMEANFTGHDSKLAISMPKLVRELSKIEQVDDNDIKTTPELPEKVTRVEQVGENKGGDDFKAEMRPPITNTIQPQNVHGENKEDVQERTLKEDMKQLENQDIKEESSLAVEPKEVESVEPRKAADMANPTPTQQNEIKGKKEKLEPGANVQEPAKPEQKQEGKVARQRRLWDARAHTITTRIRKPRD